MNKLLLLFSFYLLPVVGLNAQTWKHNIVNSDFDGSYSRVTAFGYGGSSPYDEPLFNVRNRGDKVEVYISGIGYTGCDKNNLLIVFDGKRRYEVSTGLLVESLDKDAVFIAGIRRFDEDEVLTEYHLIDEIMKSSKMSIRYSSSCKVNDFYYRLDGSTAALKRMFKNEVAFEIKYFNEQKTERIESQKASIIEARKTDSIRQMRIDSVTIWWREKNAEQKATLDLIFESFFSSPMVNGKVGSFSFSESTIKSSRVLMARNVKVLKPENTLTGFELQESNSGYFKLMMWYKDKNGDKISKYLYRSYSLTESGEFNEI